MKKFWKREKSFKECPRCGMRCIITAEECPECDMVFSRLQFATNKDAKKKIKRGDREFILMTSTLPCDVSFLKLLLWCIFGGLMGAHDFYVGRYLRGIFPLLSTITLTFFTIFNSQLIAAMGDMNFGALSTCVGFVMILWPIDIVLILMKKFKVPVAIDIDAKEEIEEMEAEAIRLREEDEQEAAAAKSEVPKESKAQKAKAIREEVLEDVNKMNKERKKKKKTKENKQEGEQS